MVNSKIDKPLSLKINDLKRDIVNLLNNSGISIFITETILKDLLFEIQNTIAIQTEKDRISYQRQLDESWNQEEGDEK